MKNTLLALSLATATMIAAPAFAADGSDNSGFFVNGNAGWSSLNKGVYNDDKVGYGLNGGYRWSVSPSVALGVETGYTYLGKFGTSNAYEGLGKAKVQGWTLGVNGRFDIAPNWYVSGRAGYFYAMQNGYVDDGNVLTHADNHSNKFYVGTGIGYDVLRNLSVSLNYDYYKTDKGGLKTDPSLVSIGAEYRF